MAARNPRHRRVFGRRVSAIRSKWKWRRAAARRRGSLRKLWSSSATAASARASTRSQISSRSTRRRTRAPSGGGRAAPSKRQRRAVDFYRPAVEQHGGRDTEGLDRASTVGPFYAQGRRAEHGGRVSVGERQRRGAGAEESSTLDSEAGVLVARKLARTRGCSRRSNRSTATARVLPPTDVAAPAPTPAPAERGGRRTRSGGSRYARVAPSTEQRATCRR